ncbi:MAG: fibronectin type III domain-containing protein [Bacteroidales bacterium]|nr:fibronectin type III domain-containing protein [Bacteroidales bacterium]
MEDTEAPSAPVNLAANAVTSTSATLNWEAATDNVGVAKYLIYRDGTVIDSTNLLSFTEKELIPEITYGYYVTAKDEAGNEGLKSNAITVTTPAEDDTEAPTAPANLIAEDVKAGSITLSWQASADNLGVGQYYIYRDSALVDSTSALSYIDTGLVAATSYSYFVIAMDQAGNLSPKSGTCTAKNADGAGD